MRKLVTLVAALVLAWPFAAASKEVPGLTVLKDPDRVAYTAYFTTSTEAGVYYIGTAFPTAVLDFEFGSDFSGVLYACDTPDGAGDDDLSDDAECVALATLATADSTVDPLKAKKLWYVLDINTAGTATLTIKGSWDQVTDASTTDADGDGLYEYVRFPQDFDGDGSSWTTCTAEGTPDAACPSANFRVWTDFADDFNAAQDLMEVGSVMTVDEGGYVIRAAVCSGGTRDGLSCSSDAACTGGGTCDAIPGAGYDFKYTYPSGEARSSALTGRTAMQPVAWKSNIKIIGAGADINGFTDGVLSGSWIIDDLSWAAGTDGSDPDVSLKDWAMSIGFDHTSCADNSAYGTCLFDEDLDATGLVDDPTVDVANGLLCLCDTSAGSGGCTGTQTEPATDGAWAAGLSAGDWLMLDGAGYTDNGNTAENGPIFRVIATGGSCDSGAGLLVRAHDGTFDAGTSLNAIEVYRVDPRMQSVGIELTGFNFVPQNPLQQNGYGADWPLADNCGDLDDGQDGSANGVSGAFTAAAPTASAADFDPDCDLQSSIGLFAGYQHQVYGNAFHHSSALSGPGTMDGSDGCIDCTFRDNYLGPTSAVTSMLDTGTGWEVHDNIFEGCAEYETSTGSCFRTLGDSARFFRNRFINIGLGRCQDTDNATTAAGTDFCQTNSDCSGSCSIYPVNWASLRNGDNEFTDNIISGLTARSGLDAAGADLMFARNRVTGVSGDTPLFLDLDPSNANARDFQFLDNVFRFMSTRGTNNAWIRIVQDTNQVPKSVKISGNRFIATEDADSASNQTSPIRMGTGTTEVSSHAEYDISGNIVFGYDVLSYRETGTSPLTTALPPSWRRNIFNDVMITERGGDTYANVISGITCDISTKGDAYTITDSDSCSSDTAGTNAQCYCDGSSWTDRP